MKESIVHYTYTALGALNKIQEQLRVQIPIVKERYARSMYDESNSDEIKDQLDLMNELYKDIEELNKKLPPLSNYIEKP